MLIKVKFTRNYLWLQYVKNIANMEFIKYNILILRQ